MWAASGYGRRPSQLEDHGMCSERRDCLGIAPAFDTRGGGKMRIQYSKRKDSGKHRLWLLVAVFALLWATPATADSRIIVRTTLCLQGLQQICSLPLLQNCAVVGALDGTLNQLFLITTPLDPTTFLSLIRVLPGIVDAELDQLISLLGGLNQATTAPSALSDSTPVTYFNSTVWNGYANQPAAQIVRA